MPVAYLDVEVEEKQDEGEHVGRLEDEAAEGEATGPHHGTQRVGDGEDELHLKEGRGEGRGTAGSLRTSRKRLSGREAQGNAVNPPWVRGYE